MSRHFIKLTSKHNRALAKQGIDRAPDGWLLELREPTRSNEQSAAMWSLIGQVQKQRPAHNGMRMTQELWKMTFMDAWGCEVIFLPKLDGDGMFPAGHRSSQLVVSEMSSFIEFILAWMARAGLTIEHFDEADRREQAA